LATNGKYWQFFENKRQQMAAFGNFWQQMVTNDNNGNKWQQMVTNGKKWQQMVTNGNNFASFGNTWQLMANFCHF